MEEPERLFVKQGELALLLLLLLHLRASQEPLGQTLFGTKVSCSKRIEG